MKAFIHYNARDFHAPDSQNDKWHNYANPDSAKMFCVCADSWQRQGFEPVRLDSSRVDGFHFSGKLLPYANDKGKCYPLEFWNVWFLLRKLAPCLWITTDVINWGYRKEDMQRMIWATQADYRAFGESNVAICWNAFAHVWTNACSYVTKEFCEYAIELFYAVDAGEIELPNCELVSDESILRETLSDRFIQAVIHEIPTNTSPLTISRVMGVSPVRISESAPLQHYSRSSLRRGIDSKWPIVK